VNAQGAAAVGGTTGSGYIDSGDARSLPRHGRDPINAEPWCLPADATPPDPEIPGVGHYLDLPIAHGWVRVRGGP
jgi:hypothetical protein